MMSIHRSILNISRLKTVSVPVIFKNNYAKPAIAGVGTKKKKVGKLGPMVEKKVLPVETDVQKLVKFVCGSNINKEGADVEIKPDSEYPDWLWTLHTGPAIPLEEMDPNTKQYWRKVRAMGLRRNNKLAKVKPI